MSPFNLAASDEISDDGERSEYGSRKRKAVDEASRYDTTYRDWHKNRDRLAKEGRKAREEAREARKEAREEAVSAATIRPPNMHGTLQTTTCIFDYYPLQLTNSEDLLTPAQCYNPSCPTSTTTRRVVRYSEGRSYAFACCWTNSCFNAAMVLDATRVRLKDEAVTVTLTLN